MKNSAREGISDNLFCLLKVRAQDDQSFRSGYDNHLLGRFEILDRTSLAAPNSFFGTLSDLEDFVSIGSIYVRVEFSYNRWLLEDISVTEGDQTLYL